MREAERLYQEFLNTGGKSGISKEDYMARLQEGKEALQEAEISIRDGIQQIGEELSNTFDLVDEKLDQQFTKFDQMIELMEHYKNVVSLTEGEASYKEFNKILKASQEILHDRIEADKSEYAMWTARRKQLEAEMKDMDKNSPEFLAAEEALNNIMEKEADAKSQLMADIEQLGEYAQEIFENAIEQAKIDFEEAMFGGRLSSVIESIDMLNAK
jgi:chromosome condensin MukBEF ATPase and DNA-binding subunit MukB